MTKAETPKAEPKKPTLEERVALLEKAILTGDPVTAAGMVKGSK